MNKLIFIALLLMICGCQYNTLDTASKAGGFGLYRAVCEIGYKTPKEDVKKLIISLQNYYTVQTVLENVN